MSARQVIGLVIVVIALAASVLLPSRLGQDDPNRAAPTHGCERARERDEGATLCLLNAERKAQGLRPLRRDRALDAAARRHALDMRDRGFFAHDTPEGVTPHRRIAQAGYHPARLTGENLAKGEGSAGEAAAIVDGWMHSPGHRANVLRRRFEEIGVAIATDGEEAIYVTTFGARR